MADSSLTGVLVWLDNAPAISTAAWEALGVGRRLAGSIGGPLIAVIFGQGIHDQTQDAIGHGADQVIVCDDPTLAHYRLSAYAPLLSRIIGEHRPAIVIGAATANGRELIATVATDFDAAPLADAVQAEVIDGALHIARQTYSGKLIATQHSLRSGTHGAIQFLTTHSRAFPLPSADVTPIGEVVAVAPTLAESAIADQVTGVQVSTDRVSLGDARIVVTGGRGVGGPDGFAPIRELAEALGAAVGASRATVDAGWIAYEHQVGQTGKVVSPDLYIAIGVSGAVQHQAGMRTARTIVAINKDPDAPIFRIAQYGIVGDLFQVVPALTKAIREAKR